MRKPLQLAPFVLSGDKRKKRKERRVSNVINNDWFDKKSLNLLPKAKEILL